MKEKTEPININVRLKRFFEQKQVDLKRETGKFHNMTDILIYYLKNNDEFINEFMFSL